MRGKFDMMRPVLVYGASPKTAQTEVFEYVRSHPDVHPDEMADALNLDRDTIIGAVGALVLKGKVSEFSSTYLSVRRMAGS